MPKGHLLIVDEVGKMSDGWINDWSTPHNKNIEMDRWTARFSGNDKEFYATELFGTRDDSERVTVEAG